MMDQEQDWMFVYNDETYNKIPSILNFNHILQDITFFNLTAEITILVSFNTGG
jgi:hypothetical protein